MSEGTQNGLVEGLAADERPLPQARLRRLTIQRFRNVRPTTLTFDDEWNVLLGKNGTGKTTLLELIAATLRGDLKALIALDSDVELQAELSFGPVDVTWVVERREPSPALSAPLALQNLHLPSSERPDRRFTIRVSGEDLPSYERKGTVDGFDGRDDAGARSGTETDRSFVSALFGKYQGTNPLPNTSLALALEPLLRTLEVARFDELLTVFDRMGPKGTLTIAKIYDNKGGTSCSGSFCSEELLRAVSMAAQPDDDRVSVSHEKLRFLRRFVELCGFEASWFHLTTLERKKVAGRLITELGRPSFLFRRHNQEELREDRLSFGQKRLLSFLYYTTLADPIVADELVDGLHYDWIEACVNEVRGRQKFFASQNPLLVDHMGFKKRESVRSRFLRCTAEGDELVWSNLSAAEADDFFVAYRTGISAVSDVLRRKGLW